MYCTCRLLSRTGPLWIWIEYLWPRGNIPGSHANVRWFTLWKWHFKLHALDWVHYFSWDCTRLRLHFVWCHISLQRINMLIKAVIIDSSFQLSSTGVSTESVITQQILREQLRWLMSWGTGNWLWVESAASGDGELEPLLQHFLPSVFLLFVFWGVQLSAWDTAEEILMLKLQSNSLSFPLPTFMCSLYTWLLWKDGIG